MLLFASVFKVSTVRFCAPAFQCLTFIFFSEMICIVPERSGLCGQSYLIQKTHAKET